MSNSPERKGGHEDVTLNTKPLHESYRTVCAERDTEVDERIFSSLECCSDHVYAAEEPHITLLIHLLSTLRSPAPGVYLPKRLTICGAFLPAAAVGTLATYLTHQMHLTHLTITKSRLPDNAAETLLTALAARPQSPLTHLTLSDNGISTKSGMAMAPMLQAAAKPSGTLESFDVSNNALNWPGVKALEGAKTAAAVMSGTATDPANAIDINVSGNLVVIETWNTITHGVGALAALGGGVELTKAAFRNELDAKTIISIVIFCISLFILLTSSCAYHSMFRYPRRHAFLRRLDHCSIFLLIAGSYTPFLAAYSLQTDTGLATLVAVWAFAIVGVVRSLLAVGSNKARALFALLTGWIGVLSLPTMKENMQHGALLGVFAGGIVYSVGIVFYLVGKKKPLFHVIWHFAVMIGGALHYLTLLKYVVNNSA